MEQLSKFSEDLAQAEKKLRPEYTCGIPEEEWNGCVPPSLVLQDMRFEVLLHILLIFFECVCRSDKGLEVGIGVSNSLILEENLICMTMSRYDNFKFAIPDNF